MRIVGSATDTASEIKSRFLVDISDELYECGIIFRKGELCVVRLM